MTEEPVPPFDLFHIDVLPTPNPDARIFRVSEALVPGGTYEFADEAHAAGSPLPEAIFAIRGVTSVLVARHFVTVTRAAEAGWSEIATEVQAVLRSFLGSGEVAIGDELAPRPARPTTDVERRILAVIETDVRPAIAHDGGDVEYMGFFEGIVELRLQGACGSCPHATATLAFGIQRYLMEQVPEVRGVRRVF
jgi:NFU1 iron-sulfur cluster scaffold homolog, mitochondrial